MIDDNENTRIDRALKCETECGGFYVYFISGGQMDKEMSAQIGLDD